jgi:hypothetical protein
MRNEATLGAQLRLPAQVAPVDRTPRAAATIGESGVTASAWTDLFMYFAPPIVDFAPPLLSPFSWTA